MFWKKKIGKKIRKELSVLERKISNLKDIKDKKERILATVQLIKENILHLEAEITERADEEKSNPLIDVKYDKEINKLAKEELSLLKKLYSDLDDYLELVSESNTSEEINELTQLIQQEGISIELREKDYQNKLAAMKKATLNERFRTISANPPPLRTSDKISWNDIAKVARELGGWVELRSGKHQCAILFPESVRPITLSADVNSQVIAKEFKKEIVHLPENKRPTIKNIKDAFKEGSLTDIF